MTPDDSVFSADNAQSAASPLDSSVANAAPRPNPGASSNLGANPNWGSSPNLRFDPRLGAPRPAPPVPPFRPIRFWQILLKDLLTTALGVALFCSLTFVFILVGIGVGVAGIGALLDGDSSSTTVIETPISGEETDPAKVVVLPIEGVIETDEYGFLSEAIECVRDDDRVRALVLRVNSPGGTIAGSDYYYAKLKQLKEELNIPVVVSMGDVAASGGYYISTVADKIFAERSTETGSIGVIISMYDASALCEKLGVASTPVVSGPMKGMGDFMKKPSPEERAIWQEQVDESYEQFLSVVRAGRPYFREGGETTVRAQDSQNAQDAEDLKDAQNSESVEVGEDAKSGDEIVFDDESDAASDSAPRSVRDAELRKIADGRIYSAKQALDAHLIDEIGFLDDAIDAALEAAGLDPDSTEIVRYEEPESLADALGLVGVKAKDDAAASAIKGLSAPKGYYMIPRALPIRLN